MKVALAQMEVVPGRPRKNLEAMLRMIEEAKQQHADLVAFPEMCVGGYLLGDKWTLDDFCLGLTEFNEALRKASEGIAIAYGNVYVDKTEDINSRVGDSSIHPNMDGRSRKYNAVYVFQNGKAVERLKETQLLPPGMQPKTLLPNYRIFDDKRYFFSTTDIAMDFGVTLESLLQPFLIEIGGRKVPIGFELCEDLWCEDYRKEGKVLNPTKMLIENGAQLIVNLSASPWTYGKNAARDRRVRFLKHESGDKFVPFLYVNCIGAQNNGKDIVTFDGGSTVYNADGLPVVLSKAPYQQELIIVENADFAREPVQRLEKPRIAQKYEAIITGIRHVKDILGLAEQPNYVIGLSGGIDSAVVAALLVKAVGKGKVLAVNMPTSFNTAATREAAAEVARRLGIAYEVVPIGELVTVNQQLIDRFDMDGSGRKLSSFQMENLQAKIRGTSILSNIGAKYGALFTSNGNKLEVALGYATLYGDVGGAIAPIGDSPKSEVFEFGHYLNREVFGREVIPEKLFPDELFRFGAGKIRSGPELAENQISPLKFGYHCAILEAVTNYVKRSPEDIMRWYLEGTMEERLGISTALIQRWGMDEPEAFAKDLEWFVSQMQRSVFKRVQAPPIIITSKSAFGYDIRESMLPWEPTPAYGRLKAEVLAMKQYEPRRGNVKAAAAEIGVSAA